MEIVTAYTKKESADGGKCRLEDLIWHMNFFIRMPF